MKSSPRELWGNQVTLERGPAGRYDPNTPVAAPVGTVAVISVLEADGERSCHIVKGNAGRPR